jgi:glycosyltransferase involved in cell wall biosynthesis
VTTPVAVIAWAGFQPRSVALARDLSGEICFVHFPRLARHRALVPLRYALAALRTWRWLEALDPRAVIVITPPVVAPTIVWAWCRLRGRPYVVDCHTDAFHSRRWRWARAIHKKLLRQARLVLLHTEAARGLVAEWGAESILLPDDLPDPMLAEAMPRRPLAVLVAGGLDDSEPVRETIGAAAALRELEVRVTGDPARVPAALRDQAAPNVVLTGYLAYPKFLGEMRAAAVVAALSNDPQVMNRAAFEAVALERPLVLSDHDGLRKRFGKAALFTANEPEAIAATIRAALARQKELEARSHALRVELEEAHERAMGVLRNSLDQGFDGSRAQSTELPA